MAYDSGISSKVVGSRLTICMKGLKEFMENFRQGISSEDWYCYKTSDRVSDLKIDIATKLQTGYLI